MKTLESLCDQCVKCGLCLPHCPTYQLLGRESESPRGRIALIEALQSGHLQPTPELLAHLDRCLLCRACEAHCPARVEYNLIMDLARERLFLDKKASYRPPWMVRLLTFSLSAPPLLLRLNGYFVRLYQRTGMQWLVRKTGASAWFGLARYEAIIPTRPKPIRLPHSPQSIEPVVKRSRSASKADESGSGSNSDTLDFPPRSVAIFQGCMGAMLDFETVEATQQVLQALGYHPILFSTQQCCGALALHQGDAERARQLARNNLRAFKQADIPIVFIATGCGMLLKEYGQLFDHPPEHEEAKKFAERCVEICDFVANDPALKQLSIAPLSARVAVHTPCSLRNVLKTEASLFKLLNHIPNIETIPLPSNHLCCGAAGSYMLTQPEISHTLLSTKLADLKEIEPDIFVSSNIGCLLHIQSGAEQARHPLPSLHPITLLARQLEPALADTFSNASSNVHSTDR